ncbi:Mitochondrial matrix iron chaperone [Cryptotrichosporon argae]
MSTSTRPAQLLRHLPALRIARAALPRPASPVARAAPHLRSLVTLPPASARRRIPHARAISTHGDPANDPSVPVLDLTPEEYHDVSDETMDTLHENLEIMCEDHGNGHWEVEYSSGVMTLSLPHGTYVINKQPPNQQIWVSSPVSGPARFAFSPERVWVHHRQYGVTLGGLLGAELGELVERSGGKWDGVGIQ